MECVDREPSQEQARPRLQKKLNRLRRMRHSLELELLRLLPGEALVRAKVAVFGSLEVDGLSEVELLDNDTGPQVKVVTDDLDKLIRRLLRGAVGVDVDGKRFGNADRVGQLDERAASKTRSHNRLCNPAADIGGGSVDLGEILA